MNDDGYKELAAHLAGGRRRREASADTTPEQVQTSGVAAVASGSQFFPVRCPRCGWTGMSNETEGGGQIADTGDYSDIVCPKCVHVGGEWNGPWIPVEEAPSANIPVCRADTKTDKL